MNASALRNPLMPAPAAPAGEPPPPVVISVSTHTGEVWQMGQPPPQPAGAAADKALAESVIGKIIPFEDGTVKIYAFPQPGSELDKQATAMEFTLYPLTINRILTLARFDTIQLLIDEAEREEEEDDDEPEDPEELPPTGAPGPATTNGSPPTAGAPVS